MILSNVIQLNTFTPGPKEVPESNYVVSSSLNECKKFTPESQLSVKLVLDGTERYRMNNKRYDLNKGEFLMVNKGDEVSVSFKDTKLAEGVCFYVKREYTQQALQLENPDWGIDAEFKDLYVSFFSGKFNTQTCEFGGYIQHLGKLIKNDAKINLSEDFFIQLALNVTQHQKGIFKSINQLPSVRIATRIELYRRVLLARDYIEDQDYHEKISIEQLAKVSALSEVQLHRAFKHVFGITPHRYIIDRKINHAALLLRTKKHTVSEISILLGFPDTPTFSKCFKKLLGLPPSIYTDHI